MKKDDLKKRIESYEKGNLLEAFVLQSAYIESLIKLFVDTKLSISLRDADTLVSAALKDRVEKYSLHELINFLFDSKWLPQDRQSLFHLYRKKRNKVLHDLLRQISTNDFEKEIEEVYQKGKEIMSLTEFSVIDDFFGVIEKQSLASPYTPNLVRPKNNIQIDERENEVMRLRLEGKTYKVIARKFGITGERIRQILSTAILKINGSIPSLHKTPTYVDPSGLKEVKSIIGNISKIYNISIEDLLGGRRMANLVFPRHLAMYFLRKNTKLSFPAIARVMKKKDHTTIIHAYQKMDHLIRSEKINI